MILRIFYFDSQYQDFLDQTLQTKPPSHFILKFLKNNHEFSLNIGKEVRLVLLTRMISTTFDLTQ